MRPINRFFLSLSLVVACLAPVAAAPTILVDGIRLPADVPASVSGDRVLVPLRGVFERLGARVSFDAPSRTASAVRDGTLVQVTVGSPVAWVNGQRRTLDVGAKEVAGRVLIPLRFVAQALGVAVDYDSATDSVVIVSGQKPGSFAAMTSGPPIVASAPKLPPTVEDERPAPGSLIGSPYPTIYARLGGGSSAVNPSSVQITVDGEDVTASSTVSSAYVSYTPSTALATGQHTVSISGSTDDGAPLSDGWTFRVDAGTSSDYTAGTYGGGAFPSGGFGSMAFAGGGFDGFGFPLNGFRRFGFFPAGFSVFTPGPLLLVSGNLIEVIFVSQFFPFGNGFFTVSGIPGTFPLTPWLGCPGFFWGFARVPGGVTAANAIIAARFTTPAGQKVVVHSTAPMRLEGDRTTLPSSIRYAVLPRLVNRPSSPKHAVVFERVLPVARLPHGEHDPATSSVGISGVHPLPVAGHRPPVEVRTGLGWRSGPGWRTPPEVARPRPVFAHPFPIPTRPVIRPVMRPIWPGAAHLQPGMGFPRFSMMQWQQIGPATGVQGVPAKPKR